MYPQRPRLRFTDQLVEATASLASDARRSMGMAAAMAVGLAAVIATVGVTTTAARQVSDRFDSILATEVRIVLSPEEHGFGPLEGFPDDIDHRLGDLAGVANAGIVGIGGKGRLAQSVAEHGDTLGLQVDMAYASPGGLAALRPDVRGRSLLERDIDRRERVVLLGRSVVERMATSDPVGSIAFLDGMPFVVIGVIDDVARNHAVLASVVLPISTARAQFDTSPIEQTVVIDVLPGAAATVARQAAVAIAPDQPSRFHVVAPLDPEELRLEIEDHLSRLGIMVGVAIIAIGTLGIANSTAAAVVHRTTEFGIRRSLGARASHLYRLVLTETLLVGLIGGSLGTILGTAALMVVVIVNGWSPVIDPIYLGIGPLAGTVVGAVAGLAPAWRAARIEPLSALRG